MTDTKEDIDLSWVTFSDENPTEPCGHEGCKLLGEAREAEFIVQPECGHEYYFCTEHTLWTQQMLNAHKGLMCAHCGKTVFQLSFTPLKRG